MYYQLYQVLLHIVEMKHPKVIFQVLEFLVYIEMVIYLRYRNFDEFDLIVELIKNSSHLRSQSFKHAQALRLWRCFQSGFGTIYKVDHCRYQVPSILYFSSSLKHCDIIDQINLTNQLSLNGYEYIQVNFLLDPFMYQYNCFQSSQSCQYLSQFEVQTYCLLFSLNQGA